MAHVTRDVIIAGTVNSFTPKTSDTWAAAGYSPDPNDDAGSWTGHL
jgi:hypothetical protein